MRKGRIMSNGLAVDFTELNELNPFFKDQEKIMTNTVTGSFLKGAAVAKKALISATPGKLKKFNTTLAIKKVRPKDGVISVLVGYFGRKIKYVNKRGIAWDAFFLLYWKNYGTLKKRDSSHAFQYNVRPGASKMKGGINPLKFYDQAAEACLSGAFQAIEDSTEKELNKQVLKYGFK